MQIQSPLRLLLVGLAVGWATDALFYGKSLGLSVLLFVLLMLGALAGVSRMEGVRLARRNLWILLPLLFFAAMVFVRANAVLTLLNVFAVICLLFLLLFFLAADNLERLGLFGYPVILMLAGFNTLTRAAPVVSGSARMVVHRRDRLQRAAPLLRGLLLSLPVLALFTVLLSSADMIFAGYVSNILHLNLFVNLPELLWQLTRILMLTWIITGALVYALYRRRGTEDRSGRTELPGTLLPDRILGFTEGIIILSLVNLLFTGFAWVQFTFLFSGEAVRVLQYEAYREYVRHGFGELLVASVLTLVLILGLSWSARHETPQQVRIFNALCTLMVALVMVMLVSAFMRMVAWENVQYYISTPIRLYVRTFILWLGITFVWLLVTLWSRHDRFAIGAFVAVLGFLVTVNVLNPDADAAMYNISRYEATQDDLSTRYLYTLSDDAVPVLVAALDQTSGDVQKRIRADLNRRLAIMERNPDWRTFPSFHLARWQAYELLNKQGAVAGNTK